MRRNRVWTALVAAVPPCAAALAFAPGCGNNQLAALAQNCSLNSDCDSPLVCVFSRCHNACKSPTDCPLGERCVPSGTGTDNVCQLTAESTCAGAVCEGNQVCGAGQQCRQPCEASSDCTGGALCESIDGTSTSCYDTTNSIDVSLLVAAGVSVEPGDAANLTTSDAAVSDGPGISAAPPDATGLEAGGEAAAGEANEASVSDGAAGRDATVSDGGATADAPFVANADAGVLGFAPSNVDLASVDAGALASAKGPFGNAPDVTVTANESCTTGAACGGSPSLTITLSDGNFADLFILNSLTLPDTASLTFANTNPVILAVLTTVSIQGTIYVNDGNSGGFPVNAPGPGAGHGGTGFAPTSGWGGGSFCGAGGQGGSSAPPVPAGGSTYGTANLIPLVAGSNGYTALGDDYFLFGSKGGGAIEIVAGQSITVGLFGHIHAGGQGGTYETAGGGSGGAILLEAPTVIIHGTLAANGGGGIGIGNLDGWSNGADGNPSAQPALGGVDGLDGGTATGGIGSAGTTVNGGNGGPPDPNGTGAGSGGGGAGRIRINTASGSATIDDGDGGTSNVSPALSTPCATQGTLGP